ncbi:MAG: polysaccharide biosynthesis/export family protein [Armatimonadetes bacterium]|nr:polysaccharide biosynthesis/export family protein [Armatimonadota bacterium]
MTCSHSARRGAAAWLWAALLLLVALAAGGRPACAQQSKTIDVNAKIHVTVADEADVTSDYTVDPDGNISMLYVNQVHVAGLTTAQAAAKLASKQYLGKFYRHPQVVVTILNPGGITVTVSGLVTTQRDFTVRSDAHLNEVILAADPTVDANLGDVQITHGIPGQPKTTDHINFLTFRNDNKPEGNPQLHDGDVIYVPAKTAAPIEVTLRGDFAKIPTGGKQAFPAGTTVYDAIQQTGGPTPTVDLKSYAIQHAGDETKLPFDYNAARQRPNDTQVNPVLQDGDTLVAASLSTTTNTYNLTGAVRNPQQFPLTTPYITLSDAIARAGGLVGGSRLNETTITRTGADGKVQLTKLDARDQSVQASTKIYPGDSVNIPQGRPGFSPSPTDIIGALGGIASVFFIFGHH